MLFHAFNLTIPGVPVLVYGDEIGLTGGNDPDSRRMMKFEGLNNREIKLRDQISTLAHLRRDNPVLIYGDFINLKTTQITWVYARKYFDKQAIVFLNNSPESQSFEVLLPIYLNKTNMKSVFGNSFNLKNEKINMTLPAYSIEVIL